MATNPVPRVQHVESAVADLLKLGWTKIEALRWIARQRKESA